NLPMAVLIIVRPSPAKGTISSRRKQKTAELTEKPSDVTLSPHSEPDEHEPPRPDPSTRQRFPPAKIWFAPKPNGAAPGWTGQSTIPPKGVENPQASCDSVKAMEAD